MNFYQKPAVGNLRREVTVRLGFDAFLAAYAGSIVLTYGSGRTFHYLGTWAYSEGEHRGAQLTMVRICSHSLLYRSFIRRFSSSTQTCSISMEDSHLTGAGLGQATYKLRFDFALFPLSPLDRSLLLGTGFCSEASDKKLARLTRCICENHFPSCVPLFFSVLYCGNALRLSSDYILQFLALSKGKYGTPNNPMHREAVRWLLNIGYLNKGWREPRFFALSSHVINKFFPHCVAAFLNHFAYSARVLRMRPVYCTRHLYGLIRDFSCWDLHLKYKALISDRRIVWPFRVSIVETLIVTDHADAVFDVLVDGPWPDKKVRFLHLCRFLLRAGNRICGDALTRLGERVYQLSAHEDNPIALSGAYHQLTRDISVTRPPLSFAMDIFYAMMNDKILPPWPYYTMLIIQLKSASYDVVKLIYRALLDRCEGRLPNLADLQLLSPSAVKPFTAFIQAASLNHDLEGVRQACDDLLRLQIPCGEVTYIVLINHLRNHGDFESIYTLYGYLRQVAFPMTPKLFAAVIDGLGRSSVHHPLANLVLDDAAACGAHLSAACLSVVAGILVRSLDFFAVVQMWSSAESLILERCLLNEHFVSLLFKSYARIVRDPIRVMELWRKIKTDCPTYRFKAANFIVVLSHLVRLHYRPKTSSDPNFEWPTDMVPISQDAEPHFKEILSDLSILLSTDCIPSESELRHLRWFGATFPLIKKLLTDLDITL
ncbi:hypothetical protein L0F63_004912 [Massospora cicadina]|nr:hypothetical protein L0F63_004912 [Massospora cicadina]